MKYFFLLIAILAGGNIFAQSMTINNTTACSVVYTVYAIDQNVNPPMCVNMYMSNDFTLAASSSITFTDVLDPALTWNIGTPSTTTGSAWLLANLHDQMAFPRNCGLALGPCCGVYLSGLSCVCGGVNASWTTGLGGNITITVF